MQSSELEQAQAVIETLEKEFPTLDSDSQVIQAKSAVKLAAKGGDSQEEEGDKEKLIANIENLSNEERFKLASIYLNEQDNENAINEALKIVKKDPKPERSRFVVYP